MKTIRRILIWTLLILVLLIPSLLVSIIWIDSIYEIIILKALGTILIFTVSIGFGLLITKD